MISAVDFGSSAIRCLYRDPNDRHRLKLFAERSEYALIPSKEEQIRSLSEADIPFAVCEGSLAVVGNAVNRADWLTQVPLTPLFDEGRVPEHDPPARQMINLLLESILPASTDDAECCAVVLPGDNGLGDNGSTEASRSSERFLCQLIRMRGYRPLPVDPAAAAVLATGVDDAFTGISVVLGAQATAIALTRLSRPLASRRLAVGTDGIDLELARQFGIHRYDAGGTGYLNLEQARIWRTSGHIHLGHPVSSRETQLVRLFSDLLDRVARTIGELLQLQDIRRQLGAPRLPITVCGGPAFQPGLASLFTERLIALDLADSIAALRIADQPETAVVRGGLIFAELEAQRLQSDARAA